jgi:hypothetical protein
MYLDKSLEMHIFLGEVKNAVKFGLFSVDERQFSSVHLGLCYKLLDGVKIAVKGPIPAAIGIYDRFQ